MTPRKLIEELSKLPESSMDSTILATEGKGDYVNWFVGVSVLKEGDGACEEGFSPGDVLLEFAC